MKRTIQRAFFIVAVMLTAILASAQSQSSKPIYRNTSYSFEERAADLVSRLTLEEKQSLLGNNMAAVPRLGIKSYNVWSEALHGILSGANPTVGLLGPTSFPNSVALGSSWDPSLTQRMAEAIADEARATFQTGTKGLTFWSPVVEPIRDPRWGRTGESYGEDPYLVSVMAGGFVRGMMGPGPKYLKAVPTAKHYFANNSEFDRHVSSSNMDSRDMREFYLYPYKELIENDNLPSIMSSYNAVNHVPTSASVTYLDSIARRTYGMNGYVTGDCAAIDDIYTGHFYADNHAEATAYGLKAGVDSDCGSVYQHYATEALEKGLITMADIDRALVNMLMIRFRTGEFDPEPMVPYTKYPASMVSSPANRALAAELSAKTIVLLKNEGKALPLKADEIGSIALIGPQADEVVLGPYSGRPEEDSKITPCSAIKKYLEQHGSKAEVSLVNGANAKSKSNLFYITYFEIEKTNGSVAHYDATKYNNCSEGVTIGSGMGTEDQVRTIDDGAWTSYDNIDITDIENITVGLNIPTEGGIVEVRTGGPDGNLVGRIEATRSSGARVGGVYGTAMPMKVPALKLGFNEPQTLYLVYKAPTDAPIDEEIIRTASEADVAVVFVGTDENTATEEADRLTLNLPGNQLDLIKAVAAANKKTIVVMQTLGCVEVEEFKDLANIPGILWVGYNGQAQGDGIARAIFGDVNPGGKLNATWYKSVKDLPAITDYTLRKSDKTNGRTLWYFSKPVSYEFGYGISYTTFEYDNFSISKSSITPSDIITISVDVKNTGKYDGDEVVQVYMTTPDSPESLQRPAKRLKAFKRITVPKGQTKRVDLQINCDDLWFWDMDKDAITYDSGRYVFEIGSSSKDIRGTVVANMDGSKFKPALKVVVADCGKTVLNAGENVKARFTASLTDDSFYDQSKVSVEWTSNNPDVVSIDAEGNMTAKGRGVATITCKVTLDGKTASDSFAVKVMPDLGLSSLKVAGKPVRLTNSKQYGFIGKSGAKAPVVSATASDPSMGISITQANKLPSSAIIEVSDEITGDSNEYIVSFGPKPVSDNFSSGLGSQWTRIRPSEDGVSASNGALAITGGKGDITADGNDAKDIIVQSANCDWTASVKLTCEKAPAGMSQNAGLYIGADDDNFIKFVRAATFNFRAAPDAATSMGQLQLVIEEKGNQKSSASISLDGIMNENAPIWLKVEKNGDTYTAYYSTDGKNFELAGSTSIAFKQVNIGLFCADGAMPSAMMRRMPRGGMALPQAAPLTAIFDDFVISARGL
ncbi:MAG: glycoside hydrolase family 3 C-terminal domain-containing protein [Bacteroidales bacterium]|nr:glycoside hydrolase family 3 C-terminal domain-containing protein [Bacteroidales bacterium]